jgi:alpha-beta hydrolase superfamily lysophospholipase
MMGPIDIELDVTAALSSDEPLHQAAWLFLPPVPRDAIGVLVCLAGGTYDKHYWHLMVDGYPGYSFAEALTAQGWVVVALDHLGVGGSSDPSLGSTGLDRLCEGDVAAVAQIAGRLAAGGLAPGLRADLPLVGVGHSMGACLTTMVQASARPYAAVALLGYGVDIANVRDGEVSTEALDVGEELFRAATGAGGGRSHVVPRDLLHGLFHAPDVPAAVVAADDAVQSRVPVRAASEVTTPGFVRSHAASIDVPVLLCFGGLVDVSPDPWSEPANYRTSNDVSLLVLPASAHCHNMASERQTLFDRLGSWASDRVRTTATTEVST